MNKITAKYNKIIDTTYFVCGNDEFVLKGKLTKSEADECKRLIKNRSLLKLLNEKFTAMPEQNAEEFSKQYVTLGKLWLGWNNAAHTKSLLSL